MLGSMMFEGGDIIRERIQRYQIACDYRPGGLFVALNHKQLETLEEQKANWERYGNTQLELLDASAHSSRKWTAIATPARCWTTAAVHIHPLQSGDWRSGTPFGSTAAGFTNNHRSPAFSTSSPAVVTTARGQVTARLRDRRR
ncbi:oxidoreductase [Klebsiella michiganensis]|nr:oxidoreductase [Klebsiella michiganensis]